MDLFAILKGAFLSFALCVGVQLPVFYFAGNFLGISGKYFRLVFWFAGVISFLAVYTVLHFKIKDYAADGQLFLSGYVGGWLAGLAFGVTQLKTMLLSFLPRK